MKRLSQIREVLLKLPSVGSVTRGQPAQDALLPCVAYAQAASSSMTYDDAPYLRRETIRLRLFDRSAEMLDDVADDIDEALAPLGFVRTNAVDSPDADVKQKTLTYRAIG